MAIHGALALFLASRAWNFVPLNDGPVEPSLAVISLSAPAADESEPQSQPAPFEAAAAPRATSQVARFAAQPVKEVAVPADERALSDDALGQGRSPANGASVGIATAAPAAVAKPAEQPARSATGPVRTGNAANAEDAYGAEVHRWIEQRKSYPGSLAARGLEGTVTVAFQIDRRGKLSGPVRIIASSGEPALDRLAQQQIMAASPFPRPPASSGWNRRSFTLPLTYRPRA